MGLILIWLWLDGKKWAFHTRMEADLTEIAVDCREDDIVPGIRPYLFESLPTGNWDGDMDVLNIRRDGQYFKYMYLKYVSEIQNTILYFNTFEKKVFKCL